MKQRFSPLALALLISFPADALLLQQGDVQFELDPATLHIAAGPVPINLAQPAQQVTDLTATPRRASWRWPQRAINVSARLEGGDLRLSFSSDRPQTLNWYRMPQGETLLLPIGEGSRIPLDNAVWRHYLTTEMTPLDTNWDLKLPLWSLQHQGKVYSWLMLTPFSNQIAFATAQEKLAMRASHQFNRFNQQQAFEVLLHVGNAPLSGARRYRDYLQQNGRFSSLREKIKQAPEGEKLIGATHIYLWGDQLLAAEDVKDWPGLLHYFASPAAEALRQKMDAESRSLLLRLAGKTPEGWQQQPLIDGINRALTAQFALGATPDDANFLQAQQRQAAAVRALAQRELGRWLTPADGWGQGLAKPLIDALRQAGLPRLWLGTDNWTAAFLHPQAVAAAKAAGYLIASYDSYDTAIARGVNDSWLTAQLPTTLRESCAIVRADGSRKPGFGKQGYYLNPGCVLPYSQQRMRELVQLAGLNSLFLDVDGTGMVSDDYQPDHPTGAAQMAEARNARLAWFSATLKLPLGSEDGNAVTARSLMFAHGMETWGFGWGDKQMNQDKSSPYYLGAWWPNAQPAFFFRPAKVKQPYRTVEFDPRYRLPLYQAVFHDAIVSSHHWNYDNLKFSDVQTTRSLLSQLYNTAPMFHLSRTTLAARLPAIKRADAAFRPLHQALWDKALTDFRWLDRDGWVQQTTFSDGSTLTANFSAQPFGGVAPHSVRAKLADGRTLDVAP